MKKYFVHTALAISLLTGLSNTAMAFEKGDFLFRFGGSVVAPKSDNHPVVSVDDGTSFTFNFGFMFTEHWAIDVLAAYPFKHDISLVNGSEVASTKHLPPTVSLQYHFLPDSRFQPYIGAGVNYTNFFSEKTFGALEGTDLNLDDSWGLAAQAGIDFMMNEKWFLNADVRYMDIGTDATLDGAPLGKVNIDPWVYGLNVGLRF